MIHNTAIIDKTAIIPESCEIGPSTIIGPNVKLGENVKILANAYLEHCEIGDNCFIAPFASIGTPPQDYGYKGEPTKTIIGKDSIIREYATINRASGEGKSTNIGEGCMIMTSAHVAHNCQIGDHVILANLVTLGGHIHIGDYAFIGGMSVFHQNVRIGEQCIVSGASAARQDVLPYSKSAGRPAAPHARDHPHELCWQHGHVLYLRPVHAQGRPSTERLLRRELPASALQQLLRGLQSRAPVLHQGPRARAEGQEAQDHLLLSRLGRHRTHALRG